MKKPIKNPEGSANDEAASELDSSDPIMRQLRNIYDDVAAEPLPSEMLDLLAKLDEAERNR